MAEDVGDEGGGDSVLVLDGRGVDGHGLDWSPHMFFEMNELLAGGWRCPDVSEYHSVFITIVLSGTSNGYRFRVVEEHWNGDQVG